MQIYNINLMLGGDRQNIIPKAKVTAAEIMVLKSIHGNTSVNDIKKTNMDKRTHDGERGRLVKDYGPKVVFALFGQGLNAAKLPVSIDDISGAVPEVDPDDNTPIYQG